MITTKPSIFGLVLGLRLCWAATLIVSLFFNKTSSGPNSPPSFLLLSLCCCLINNNLSSSAPHCLAFSVGIMGERQKFRHRLLPYSGSHQHQQIEYCMQDHPYFYLKPLTICSSTQRLEQNLLIFFFFFHVLLLQTSRHCFKVQKHKPLSRNQLYEHSDLGKKPLFFSYPHSRKLICSSERDFFPFPSLSLLSLHCTCI